MESRTLNQLMTTCESALATVGYDLVDLEYLTDQSGAVLRLFIDHLANSETCAASSITHSDCELASQQVGTTLDVEDVISGPYRLEVSSPGVYRRIRKERDFARFNGRRVRVELRQSVQGRKKFVGQILNTKPGVIELKTPEGQIVDLPLIELKKALLDEELELTKKG